jgi:GT2 family glycosyltransferase
MQPSRATAPVIVPTFIGFAHLLRRSVFLQLGGYREALQFYGEEKEYGVRLMDAGYKTVYLPDARVAHVIDRASRNAQRHLRMVARNDCLTSLYNDPIERAIWMVPARFCLYFRMRHGWKISDPGGGWWLFRDLAARLPEVVRDRRPVSRGTIARWRDLNTRDVPYEMPNLPEAASRVG